MHLEPRSDAVRRACRIRTKKSPLGRHTRGMTSNVDGRIAQIMEVRSECADPRTRLIDATDALAMGGLGNMHDRTAYPLVDAGVLVEDKIQGCAYNVISRRRQTDAELTRDGTSSVTSPAASRRMPQGFFLYTGGVPRFQYLSVSIQPLAPYIPSPWRTSYARRAPSDFPGSPWVPRHGAIGHLPSQVVHHPHAI